MIVTLLIMVVGLVGTVMPVIPGILLIYAGYLLYGFATGWQAYGLAAIVWWSVVTALILLLDFYAGAIGAKRYGASRSGTWGSLIVGLIGTLAAGFPGLILGPFVGAALGELVRGRSYREALRSGWGTFMGFLFGSVVKIALGVVMIGTFIWWVLF
ncbi:MAG TPA: DUF456 domain-containing protein [Terriglobia bacterium]|nr:DUF456 domain-containing protein [Terriglobia bacterium]